MNRKPKPSDITSPESRMKRRVSTQTLQKRLPKGFALPATFDGFVKSASDTDPAREGWFEITWSDPARLGFRRESRAELVPFLRLGDGGIVAFWIHGGNAGKTRPSAANTAAIAHVDSEGGHRLCAADFDDFLVRLALRKTGVPDIDEAGAAIPSPGKIPRVLAPAKLAPALRARFAKWCSDNTDEHTPAKPGNLEPLRKKLHALAFRLLRDGFHTIYKTRSAWWNLNLKAVRQGGALKITCLDCGDWKPLPAGCAAEPLVGELLAHAKHPGRPAYEIAICKDGLVSVERDRELVLDPAAAGRDKHKQTTPHVNKQSGKS